MFSSFLQRFISTWSWGWLVADKDLVDLKRLGLSVLRSHIPKSPFRFEPGVALGTCEIQAGVRIGMHSYMNDGFIRSGVEIGRYCSIGRNVTIGTGHHEMSALSTSSFFKVFSKPSTMKLADPIRRVRVKVGHDVWIGDRVIILSGVSIGNGAVLAAGAVVATDVPDYAVVGGVPARFLKWRFPEDMVHRLVKLRWWEFEPEDLQSLDMSDLLGAIEKLEKRAANSRTALKDRHIVI